MFATRIVVLTPRRLTEPNRRLAQAGVEEAGKCWSHLVEIHKAARETKGAKWPSYNDLAKRVTSGTFRLNAQTMQALAKQLIENVDTTRALRAKGFRKAKYPHKAKETMTLEWTNQGPRYDKGKRLLILPMGRGNPSITVRRVDLSDEELDHGMLLVRRGDTFELHVGSDKPIPTPRIVVPASGGAVSPAPATSGPMNAAPSSARSGSVRVTVDLGEIHQATAVSSTGEAVVVSGRGIRTHKRLVSQQLEELGRKQKGCVEGSRRWTRLQEAKDRLSARSHRRIKNLRDCGDKKIVEFAVSLGADALWVGNPDGVRKRRCGRRHNRRMALWEYGEDLRLLEDKALRAGMVFDKGDERGTSSQCPKCGHRHKPKGRVWSCTKRGCGFKGHRDVVGGYNMHAKAFPNHARPTFPREVTYLRPGPIRGNEKPAEAARAAPEVVVARTRAGGRELGLSNHRCSGGSTRSPQDTDAGSSGPRERQSV